MIYETLIGLEVHVELATNSKIFCSCPVSFGAEPNTRCCPVCLGLPGALPVLNKQVVDFAIRACLATGCRINRQTRFDRKNYFYPDLPKAYQISQLYRPIGQQGSLKLAVSSGREIRIREIHMEEDAGKLIHDPWTDKTMIDYNRCGIPLLEIVSEPDLRSAEEALEYMAALREILMFIGVSDCRMQEGSMRADVNVSVRPAGSEKLGTRSEMKNMNSFKAIGRAIAFESKRQIKLLESGQPVAGETRRWDENKDASFAMRDKEDARDYRYFPDPDLVGITISQAEIDAVRTKLPALPEQRRRIYQEKWGVSEYEAVQLTSHPALAALFENTTEICGLPADVSSWILGEVLQTCKEQACEPDEIRLQPHKLARLISLVREGSINRATARTVFSEIIASDIDPDSFIAKNNLKMESDPDKLSRLVDKVLAENPGSVEDYHGGKKKALSFLVGQVMRATAGKADPALVNRLLQEKLN